MSHPTIEESYELSPLQQGMLFHALAASEPGVDILQVVCHLSESIAPDLLVHAWSRVVARHPSLRTSFRVDETGALIQDVYSAVDLPFEKLDWRGVADDEQVERWRALLAADRLRGFDPSQVPLVRLLLVTLRDDHHRLLWSFHHLLMDGWAFPLVLREAFAFYDGEREGRQVELPLPRPYVDYIRWLRNLDVAGEEAYWRAKLRGFDSPTPLGVRDATEDGPKKHGVAVQNVRLSAAMTDRLTAFARANGVGLSTLVQGAWALLLHRYSGESEVVFGVTRTLRRAALDGVDGMIGLLINTLPARVPVDASLRLGPWLRALREGQADVREHEHTSLASVQAWSDVPRGTPLFGSIVVFDYATLDTLMHAQGERRESRRYEVLGQSNFPLTLQAYAEAELLVRLRYDRQTLDDEAAQRMLAHFVRLLEAMPEAADQPLQALPMLTEEDRRRVLIEWSGAGARADAGTSLLVHEAFEQQAARDPMATAVIWDSGSLTYGELNQRANRLAHYLMRRGVGPEVRVGLCVPRGPELIVALLGVLKAGGTCIPLEHTNPPARLTSLLDDAGAPIVLTVSSVKASVSGSRAISICLDTLADELRSQPDADPEPAARPENVAYVVYTSGSTGRPKGVLVEHRSLAHYVAAASEEFGVRPGDRVLQFASIAFDASAEEIYPCLARGATLLLRTDAMSRSIEEFMTRCREWGCTILDLPTAFWHEVVAALAAGAALPPAVRLVIIGGERADPERISEWSRAAPPGVRLVNTYGPTEATIVATWCDLVRNGSPVSGAPIGRPVPGVTAYVLDRQGDLVPAGVTGELYLGGPGIARGYLGQPGLTAEAFVPDPFGDSPGSRLYRTGDLVHHLPDGSLAFAGRVGFQVKVRGFRVELEEIERALRSHPAVREAVVTAPASPAGVRTLAAYVVPADTTAPAPNADLAAPASASGLRSLVAYVVAQGSATLDPRELKLFLAEKLPEYMVPSTFVTLATLPLTSAGKVDRRALPPVDAPTTDRLLAAPRDPIEELLCGVWTEVLGLADVGIHDDFFELGGDSIKSLQVMTRAASAGIRVTAEQVFRHRSIATLAAASRGATMEEAEPIPRSPAGDRRVLSAAERRLWFFDQLEPGSSAYNLGVTLHLTGALDLDAIERSLGAIVDRHETLRTLFQSAAGVPFATVVPSFPVQVPRVDLRGSPPEARDDDTLRLLADDAQKPFDLERGPLLRVLLVCVDEGRHVLGLTLHHIVTDGWSIAVFAREFFTAYEALAAGRAPSFTPLPIRYADFAAWENEWLKGSEAERQLAFWRDRLAGALPVVDLPGDFSRPPTQTFRGGSCARQLSPELSQQVAALSRAQGVTPFMTQLAAFGLLLHRLTCLEDLPVGVPVAGRNRDGVEGLIGMFINTVVIRHDLSGDPTFIEMLRRTRSRALDAYHNSQLPFDRIVEIVQPHRASNRTPLFQVLVNSVDLSQPQRFELPGLVAELGGTAVTSSKFDLTLYLGNEAGATKLVLAYNADLFLESRMEEFLRMYELLLEEVVARPDRHLSEVSLLTAPARAVLPDPMLPLDGSTGPTAVEALVAQTRREPERIAIGDSQASLSYANLERLSRGLARQLRAAGVSKGDVVALYGRRGSELVWGMIGVLRSGAAFVILDAAHPEVRIVECLRAAKPRAWLWSPGLDGTGAEIGAALDGLALAFRAELSESLGEVAGEPPQDGPAHPTPEDVAYVAFTSGTTGGVKGIVGTNGPLSHFVRWQVETFGLAQEDRFSMLSGLSHDPLLRDVFVPLSIGASLYVPDPDSILRPGALRDWLAREGITVAHLTPSHVNLLTEGASKGALPRLRYAFLGGDALTRDTVGRLHQMAPAVTVVNFYGATETPQAMGWYVVPRDGGQAPIPLSQVPLGRGIDDVQLLVLHGNGLAGIGELGEIAVRTPHLARGYLNDEALTRLRFVSSPFSGDASDRLYKTGDLGRFRPDGLVEFAGRRDGQVKIRGYRVELESVESALYEHPAIRQAAVLCLRGGGAAEPCEPRLVAYVALEHLGQVTPVDLRLFLQTRLPDYMVPGLFLTLDSLPLNTNGKVDRKTLAKLDVGVETRRGERTAPRTPTEEVLAGVWAEVLRLERVGVEEDFFELGGHSLLAMQVISRAREALGVDLALRSLFDAPTVAGLARLVDAARARPAESVPPAIPRVARAGRLLRDTDVAEE